MLKKNIPAPNLQSFQAMKVTSDCLVRLNVGGRRYMTTLSTLQSKGENFLTRLAEYYSRGDISVRTDEKGYIFIDRNGEVFQVILDYLRTNEFFFCPKTCQLDKYFAS